MAGLASQFGSMLFNQNIDVVGIKFMQKSFERSCRAWFLPMRINAKAYRRHARNSLLPFAPLIGDSIIPSHSRSNRSVTKSWILLTQRAMTSPVAPPIFRDFWTTTYAAIEDSFVARLAR